jgi:hypothetical protein
MRQIKILSAKKVSNGNWLINGTIWVNGAEMRALLIASGLSESTPSAALQGCTLSYDESIITPEMIASGNNQVVRSVPRRATATDPGTHITFTSAGAKQYNFALQLSDGLVAKMADKAVEAGMEEGKKRDEDNRIRRATAAQPQAAAQNNGANAPAPVAPEAPNPDLNAEPIVNEPVVLEHEEVPQA